MKLTILLSLILLTPQTSVFAKNTSLNLDSSQIKLTDFARAPKGNILLMNQYDATVYCKKIKARLPTAAELAAHAQTYGAKGILESAYPNASAENPYVTAEITKMEKSGYYPIYKKNTNGESMIDFYHNNDGYIAPTEYQSDESIWTSSTYSDGMSAIDPDSIPSAYAMGMRFALLQYYHRQIDSAVRCVY